MTNEKIILQLEKGYDIKNPQLAQVLTNIENNGVTKGEFTEAMGTKADLVGGKVPAEQLPSYVDDVMEFVALIAFSDISSITGKKDYANNIYITTNTTIDPYKNLYLNTGTNNSIEDWTYIPLEKGKIYLNTSNNHTYRWSGNKLIDLDKDWSDQINELKVKTITVYLGDIKDPLDLSKFQNTSVFSTIYIYLNQRARYPLINLRWRYNSVDYSSPIIDADPVERSFRIYNQGYLQTYKVLKEGSNYSLVKVKEFPDFVYLDYSTLGAILDDETVEQIKKASMVLINDNVDYPNSKSIYVTKSKTNAYLQFIKVGAIDGPDQKIVYRELSVNISTKKWVINTKNYTLPYGAYSQFGFTGKNADAVNQEVARLVNMNSCYITPSDLNKVHSGDKLENIKNATFLILDEGDGKTKIFTRGYSSNTVVYYSCITNSASMNYILLRMPSNLLGLIENAQFDDVMFSNYRAKGGTRTNKDSMYKELIAQLTENTYVIDSSKLNTVLTNEEDTAILNASTIIVSNYPNNKPMVFIRGYDQISQISFLNTSESVDGSVVFNKLKYIKNSKIASITASVANPYQWYATHGGTIKDQSNFESINAFLYDRTYIIDKALLNSTITDTSIQDSIKRANILVIEDSTNSSYKVHIRGFVTSNAMIYFFNMQNINSDFITATRVSFNTTTNLLNSSNVYLQSTFNAYKLGGGTKYTTESAFNTALAAAIDAYTPTI